MKLMELFGEDPYITDVNDFKIDSPTTIEQRFDLYRSAAEFPCLYKHIYDYQFDQVFDQIRNSNNQKWISISRTDIVDQVASFMVAMHTRVWNENNVVRVSELKQNLSPFVADLELLLRFIHSLQKFKNILNVLSQEGILAGNITYERCKSDCDALSNIICDHFSVLPECRDNWYINSMQGDMISWSVQEEQRLKKLWTKQEKIDLILNWIDVLQLLQSERII